MLVYDPSLDRYLPFGNLKTAALGQPFIYYCTNLTPDDWMKINQINIIDPDHAVSI
jgi:hypothetical protein